MIKFNIKQKKIEKGFLFYIKLDQKGGFGILFQTQPNHPHPPVFKISEMFGDRFVNFSFTVLKKVYIFEV